MSKTEIKLNYLKPITPGMRGAVIPKNISSKNNKFRSLCVGKKSTGGRDNSGKISIRFRGAGNKKIYRIIDFKRDTFEIPATVLSIEYDPNRTSNIALIRYENGKHSYILATEKMVVGQQVVTSTSIQDFDLKSGNRFPLSAIPISTQVNSVELKPGKGSQIARTAGSFATIVGKEDSKIILSMPSGETRYVPADCMATVGIISNKILRNTNLGKAGRNRWKGFRPHVRGEVMNPVDHPHGGRTRGGRISMSPWGWCTKGMKTRNKKKNSTMILSRKKK